MQLSPQTKPGTVKPSTEVGAGIYLFDAEQLGTTWLLFPPNLEGIEVPLYREGSSSAELQGEIKLLPIV